MDDKQLQKLIKKNMERAEKTSKGKSSKKYDSTLTRPDTEDSDIEREQFFDEMKRREF